MGCRCFALFVLLSMFSLCGDMPRYREIDDHEEILSLQFYGGCALGAMTALVENAPAMYVYDQIDRLLVSTCFAGVIEYFRQAQYEHMPWNMQKGFYAFNCFSNTLLGLIGNAREYKGLGWGPLMLHACLGPIDVAWSWIWFYIF